METTNLKQGGIMRSKLVMSFYRAAKPSPAMQCTVAATTTTIKLPTQKVAFTEKGDFGVSDGYVHGPNGGAGDELVDAKATSFIFHVKERLRLEEE
ncbi:Hypothetical predicted protein [Olea europaea subsp. europaea]|uniref:Uncharacterized protein n=1 Tax=Olea europaea subsp. europaea TaxID=158383 RepID=A0A8S0QI53_OLEEU|nr:Hypothetical predicted protein [Olea europaea subsp. europaea]